MKVKLSYLLCLTSLSCVIPHAWGQSTTAEIRPQTEAGEASVPSAEKTPGEAPAEEEIESGGIESLSPPSNEAYEILNPANPSLRLDLNDCIQMATLNNKEIRSTRYDVENAEWKLRQAQPRAVPTLEYEFDSAPAPLDADRAVDSVLSGEVTFFQRGKVSMAIPLFTFGKIKLAQELAKTGISAEKEKQIDKQNDIVVKAKKLYFGILFAKDLQRLLRDAERQLASEIERRGDTAEPGEATANPKPKTSAKKANAKDKDKNPLDVVRMKLYRYEVLSRLSEVESRGYLAKEGLRIILGLPKGVIFDINESNLKPVDYELKDFEHYLTLSQKFRPESKLLTMGLKAKELQYRLEKRSIAPNIGVGAFYEFGHTADPVKNIQFNDDFNNPFDYDRIGAGLRIKGDFNVKSYQAKVGQARAEYFKVALSKRAADEGLELDLKEAYLAVKHGRKNVENAENALRTARQFVFMTRTNLAIGLGDKKDYSDALQTFMLSQGRYLEAVFSYNSAVATLEQKSGGVGVPKSLQ